MKKNLKKWGAVALLTLGMIAAPQSASAQEQTTKITGLYDATSVGTGMKVNKYLFGEAIEKVYIVNNTDFADALTGGVLAGENRGALIYTNGRSLTEEAREYIEGAASVTILGGENAVSPELEASLGKKAQRVAGYSRYGTAAAVAEALGTERDLLVVSGENFADALSATAVALKENRNILLVKKNEIPEETLSYLGKYGQGKDIIFAGGIQAVSNEVKRDVYSAVYKDREESLNNIYHGYSRYDTSLALAKKHGDFKSVILATGINHTDALAAGTLSAEMNAPIILVNDASFDKLASLLKERGIENIFIIGGPSAVKGYQVQMLVAKLNGVKDFSKITILNESGKKIEVTPPPKAPQEVKLEGSDKEFSYSKVYTMKATAYDPSAGTMTASGMRARVGVVAVDRKVIPLGTKLYIESTDSWPDYGYAIAGDTGGAIKGHRIDLFFNTHRTAMNFGRRNVKVYVLD